MTLAAAKRRTLHSSATSTWGTPPDLVAFAKAAMGGIDLDPASSSDHNRRTIHAPRFLDGTPGKDALVDAWWPGWPSDRERRVLLNPPGDKTGKLVKRFWNNLAMRWLAGDDEREIDRVHAAVWVGFNLQQLVSLQRSFLSPFDPRILIAVPSTRTAFLDARGIPEENPTHGNWIALLPDARRILDDQQRAAFRLAAAGLKWGCR